VLFLGEMQSIVGDQLGRVALSVLVFERTGSATATAATYAATLLPAIIGGFLGGRVGDHVSRRVVMIVVEIMRALCFAAMALPATPLGVVIVLLVAAVAIGPVFTASQLGYLAAELEPEQFRTGTAARMMSSQSAQVIGFVLGGVVVAAIGARASLAVDAATFAVSAVAVGVLLLSRRASGGAAHAPAVSVQPTGSTTTPEPASAAHVPFAGLLGTRRVRTLLLLGCFVGFFVVPEGLAVPFANSTGATTAAVGILLAAGALGGALGAIGMTRFVEPTRREAAAFRMAVLCGLPLVIPAVVPHWPVAAACWLVSGALAAYMVEVTAALVQALPPARRSHYIGVVGALLLATQGGGLLVFGALAAIVAPATAIAVAGLVGSAAAALVTVAAARRAGKHAAPSSGLTRGEPTATSGSTVSTAEDVTHSAALGTTNGDGPTRRTDSGYPAFDGGARVAPAVARRPLPYPRHAAPPASRNITEPVHQLNLRRSWRHR
jgi:hypothetical protein